MIFTRIAVCVDDSDAARLALDAARGLAPGAASVTLIHVVEPPSFLVELAAGVGGGIVGDTGAMIEAAQAWLGSLAEPGEEVVVLSGNPVSEVAEWAADAGCDLLVMATHRGAVPRALLGSFSQRMTSAAPCSTLLVHPAAGT
jgi:nucleotide-binding universal stress UspA family protein